MTTRERTRNRLERRVFRARKINRRLNIRRSCLFEDDKEIRSKRGKLAKRLLYETKPWWEYKRTESYSEQKLLDTMKSRMEDYYEEVC